MRKPMAVCAAVCLLAGLLCACAPGVDPMQAIKDAGTLRVLVVENGGPYSRTDQSGTVREGVEVAIAEQIAADMGLSLELVPVEKAALLDSLSDGMGDLALGRIADSESLRLSYATSLCYLTGRLFAVTPAGVYFPSAQALSGKTFGVTDQLSAPASIAVTGVSDSTLQTYATDEGVENNLLTGAIAAYICYEEQAMDFLSSPALQVQNLLGVDSESYVAAAPRGWDTLIASVNVTLTRLIEAGSIDEYFAIYR